MDTVQPEQCVIEWCDQSRPHTRHEYTVGTWFSEAWTGSGTMTVQLVVHGYDDADAAPMLALVDSAGRQTDAVMDWQDAHELATAIIAERRRFERLNAPQ